MITVEAGSSVLFRTTFHDGDGVISDVTEPTLRIYNAQKIQLSENTADVVRESEGVYSCVYETEAYTANHRYYAEFSGLIDGHRVVVRDQFRTYFDI